MNDPIVDEIRRVRDAHAARFNYDLDAMFQDIKKQEEESGRTFTSFPSRRADQELQAAGAGTAGLRHSKSPEGGR